MIRLAFMLGVAIFPLWPILGAFSEGLVQKLKVSGQGGDEVDMRDFDFPATLESFQPIFKLDGVHLNVSAPEGASASLLCKIKNLGAKAVSWIRKKDLHVLTGGIITYTTDPRFHLRHDGDEGEVESWVLKITQLNREDSGLYECQVNTEPKKSLAFKLHVSGVNATVQGPKDLYVQTKGVLNLSCEICADPVPVGMTPAIDKVFGDGTVVWERDGMDIVTPRTRGRVHVTQSVAVDSDNRTRLSSQLLIRQTAHGDSGSYSCRPRSLQKSSNPVQVHVIQGENSAAMQHGESSSGPGPAPGPLVFYVLSSICVIVSTIQIQYAIGP